MKRVYATYDKIAEEFGPLMVTNNDRTALRLFQMSIQDPSFKANPEEFELWRLAEYDMSEGTLKTDKMRVTLAGVLKEKDQTED